MSVVKFPTYNSCYCACWIIIINTIFVQFQQVRFFKFTFETDMWTKKIICEKYVRDYVFSSKSRKKALEKIWFANKL